MSAAVCCILSSRLSADTGRDSIKEFIFPSSHRRHNATSEDIEDEYSPHTHTPTAGATNYVHTQRNKIPSMTVSRSRKKFSFDHQNEGNYVHCVRAEKSEE